MKKILGVSIAAMLAVTPMLASAEAISGNPYTDPTALESGTNMASTDPQYANVAIDTADQGHIASTAYVKGAYNSAIRAINKVASDNATAEGAGIDKTDGKFSVDVTSNGGLGFTGSGDAATLNVVGGDGITVGAGGVAVDLSSNKGLQIDSANHTLEIKDGAGIALDSNGVKVGITANGGLGFDETNGKTLEVKVDGTTVGVNTTSGKLELANGAVTTAKVDATTLVTSSEGISSASLDTEIPTALAVNTAVTNRLKNGSDSNAVAMESVVQQTVRDATTLTSNTGNTLASEKAVRTAIDAAVENQATQAGVGYSIGSAYVSVYDAWGADTYKNVNINSQGYKANAVQAAPTPGA